MAHDWFRSYLIGRHQYVRVRASHRLRSSCDTVYRKDRFSARSYFYCRPTPLTSQHWSGVMDYMSTSMRTTLKHFGSCSPLSTDQLQSSMSACIDVAGWMASNRLQLNASKTEIMWCSSVRRQSQRPTAQFRVCNDLETPSTVVRDLGIYLDSDVSMCSQVARTVSNCFFSY